ncbi:MAG: S8 family peptidase [Flavobacteriales bacterium]|nr:S8 family peptidase [Flavobacteriales bacterium]
MRYLSILLLLAFSFTGFSQSTYELNTLIFKAKEEFRVYFLRSKTDFYKLESQFHKIGVTSITQEYPRSSKPRESVNQLGMPTTDISLIYRLKYSGDFKPTDLVNNLMRTGAFQYVEPSFIFKSLYTPNDSELNTWNHLEFMNVLDAWDVTKGDTNVVIGISDTGFDIDHPDLVGSVKYNFSDPINSIDDDADGYIDNYRGWDLGENDNDPSINGSDHGVVVAGFAGATPDNSFQVAGTGFNCKLMPLKIADASGNLTQGYQSIVYAADHGCDVVNCSWGSPNSWSQQGQDVIDYAIGKGCLVVSAAGNSNAEDLFYPASFEFVLSVGGTNSLNQKWTEASQGSNYNNYVDVVAPSVNLYRITDGGGSLRSGGSGTSLSAPIVAGIAGLVKSQFPSYNPYQILEQLKSTAIDIDTIAFNAPYQGKLGKGLVDAHKAVTDSTNPGFIFINPVFTDLMDGVYRAGDTIYLYGEFYNMLATSSSSTAMSVTTESPYIELVDSAFTFGSFPGEGAGWKSDGAPFKFKVKDDIPFNETIDFKVIITDGEYLNWQMVKADFNPHYINVTNNNIDFTVGGNADLGFIGNSLGGKGLGVKYKGGSNILYQMGILASLNGTQSSFGLDGDFEYSKGIDSASNYEADLVLYSKYSDDIVGVNKIGLTIDQKTMSWSESKRSDFIIFEMNIKNNSGADINGLNIGVFSDWDIGSYDQNIGVYDSLIKTGYCYSVGGTYAGIHILSDSTEAHYAFNNNGSNGSINQLDGFSSAEQFSSISNGNSRDSANLGDVSQTVGLNGINILNGDSAKLTFALVVGDDYNTIKNASLAADTAYFELYNLVLENNYLKNTLCNASCDGKASVGVRGGVGVYDFQWDDLSSQTVDTASGLCSGTYNCIVVDESGISDSISVVITEPSQLVVNLMDTIMDVGSNCNGEINGTISGGSTPYLISWSDDLGRDSLHAINLCVGEYDFVVTDVNGCEVKDTIAISDLVGKDELSLNKVLIFPNPSRGIISLSNVINPLTVLILDINGKELQRHATKKTLTIDLNGFSQGVYFVKIQDENSSILKKISIIK